MIRLTLPNRRHSENLKFQVQRRGRAPSTYQATLGFYQDGRLGEIFLAAGKTGSDVDVAARDSAIAFSFALQHGCSIETARVAFCRDENGQAEGPLGTLLDLLGKRT